MIGFKVFTSHWTAVRGKGGSFHPYQYQVGKSYEETQKPRTRVTGFHFCQYLSDCFNYYGIDVNNRIALVEAYGDIDENGDAYCTNKIRILREIPWREVPKIVEAQMKGEDIYEYLVS